MNRAERRKAKREALTRQRRGTVRILFHGLRDDYLRELGIGTDLNREESIASHKKVIDNKFAHEIDHGNGVVTIFAYPEVDLAFLEMERQDNIKRNQQSNDIHATTVTMKRYNTST